MNNKVAGDDKVQNIALVDSISRDQYQVTFTDYGDTDNVSQDKVASAK